MEEIKGYELGKASSTHRSRKNCIHSIGGGDGRKDKLQYLGKDGRILKWTIMKLIGSFGSSKHVNENSSSIKCSEFD